MMSSRICTLDHELSDHAVSTAHPVAFELDATMARILELWGARFSKPLPFRDTPSLETIIASLMFSSRTRCVLDFVSAPKMPDILTLLSRVEFGQSKVGSEVDDYDSKLLSLLHFDIQHLNRRESSRELSGLAPAPGMPPPILGQVHQLWHDHWDETRCATRRLNSVG